MISYSQSLTDFSTQLTVNMSSDVSIVIENCISQNIIRKTLKVPLQTAPWMTRNKIYQKIAEFKIDVNLKWNMWVKDQIINESNKVQLDQLLAMNTSQKVRPINDPKSKLLRDQTIAPINIVASEPILIKIFQRFQEGDYCRNHLTDKYVQIQKYVPHVQYSVLCLSSSSIQTIPAQMLEIIHDIDQLNTAQRQYQQIIPQIHAIEHSLEQLRNERKSDSNNDGTVGDIQLDDQKSADLLGCIYKEMKYQDDRFRAIRIQKYTLPDKYHVLIIHKHRCQTVRGHKLKRIKNDKVLKDAHERYQLMRNKITLLDDALEQYCKDEQIKYSSISFVKRCDQRGLAVAKFGLEKVHPFCDIQPNIDLGKKMISDLFHHLESETNNVSTPYPCFTQHIDRCEAGRNPIIHCDPVKRLLLLLEMHSHLDIIGNQKHQNQFMAHMNGVYSEFLDDYIHLISEHEHHLELINSSLEACDITKCVYTSRRHRQLQIKQDHMNPYLDLNLMDDIEDFAPDKNQAFEREDNSLKFYVSTIDSLHFYLHHLFDINLRTRNALKKSSLSEIPITTNRQIANSFRRFRSQSKFNFTLAHNGMSSIYHRHSCNLIDINL